MPQKITVGFVVQEFNSETDRFVSQEFVAGDEVTWELDGEPIEPPTNQYLPFDMVQPE